MNTSFKIFLYDTYYQIYKNNKLFVTSNAPIELYTNTIVVTDVPDKQSPKGYTTQYDYSYLIFCIGLSTSVSSVRDFRTSIK